MTIQEALEEAQTLANYINTRTAIVDLNGDLEVVKCQFCSNTGVKPLEIVRPDGFKTAKAFRNLEFRGILK